MVYNFDFCLLNDDFKKFSLESIFKKEDYSEIINNENDIIKCYYSSNVNNYKKKDIILDASFISLFIYEYKRINYKENKLVKHPHVLDFNQILF